MSDEFNTGDPKLDALFAKEVAYIKEEQKKEAHENEHEFQVQLEQNKGRIPMDPGLIDQGKSEFAKTVESELADNPGGFSEENIDGEPKPGTPAHKEWVKAMEEGDID